MGTQITQAPDPTERERMELERRERRNLSKRKSQLGKEQRETAYNRLLVEAREQCENLVKDAQNAAESIVGEARSKAASMLDYHNIACAELMVRRDALRQQLLRHEAALQRQERNAPGSEHSTPVDLDAAAQFRRADAARKRAMYWRLKDINDWTPIAEESHHDLAGDVVANRKKRSIHYVVSWAVKNVMSKLERFNDKAKKHFFHNFWEHKSLKRFQPVGFGMNASVGAAVVDLKQSLQLVKTARRKDHLATKRALLTALVGPSITGNRYQTALARALGIKRHNVHKASKVRMLIDADQSLKYPMGERKVRSDKISEAVRIVVEKYWESNTRISPCVKDKARRRLAKKVHEEHRVHWLEETEVEFFFKFQHWCTKEGNDIDIGLRSFQSLKPYYIRTMKDRMVCYCKQHVEMDLLKDALNKFRKHHHTCDDCICQCQTVCKPPNSPLQSCVASQSLLGSVRGWIDQALCPKREGEEWHKKACIMGRCKKCGVSKLKWCPAEVDPTHNHFLDWQTFQYVELDEKAQQRRERKKGTAESAVKKATRLRLVYKRTSMSEFQQNVLEVMPEFIVHNFRARWQSEQFRLCLKTFPRGTVVSSIDYSENYTFKPQNEVQSMHWDNRQVTLLIHVTYRHRQDATESLESAMGTTVRMALDEDDTRDVIADYHFYISDDNKHDTLFVQHCMDLHHGWMKALGIKFDQHWVWSDGASSQFKSCRPFYYVSRYNSRFGARMKWFFHASGHGKGVADALGGHIKQGIQREQLKGIDGHLLENAHDVVNFCEQKFALGQEKEYGDVQLVRRLFWEIKVGAINRTKKWDCDPRVGSRRLHCFDGFSDKLSTLLRVRELCCFCPHCLDDDYAACENKAWVGSFKLEMIKGVLPADVRQEVVDMGVGQGGNDVEEASLGELVQVGEFYAVKAAQPNKWNATFYIMQCEESLHEIKKDFVDGYDQAFRKGEEVIKGRWFQPQPGNELKFVFHDKAPSGYNFPNEIVWIRFGLTPCEVSKGGHGGPRVYTLEVDTLQAITDASDS